MKKIFKMVLVAMATLALPAIANAQDAVEASVGADLVSGYIWRGQDLGGVSIQPAASVSYKGLSLGAWGSVGLESTDTKEFDLTLGYTTGGFSLSVTDYFFTNIDGVAMKYGDYPNNHTFEAQIGYDFGPLALNWYTNFAGSDGVNKDGKRAYSSYISAEAPFKLGGLDWTIGVGAVPFATTFYNDGANGFEVSDISLGATKEIKITDTFAVPAFAKITVNPKTEGAYFVFGMSF